MSFVSSFAPGRVELLGNHTDYNEGVILSAALDMGLSAEGRVREDGMLKLSTEGFPDQTVAALSELHPNDSWTDYPAGVAKVFRDAGYPIGGFEASYRSSLPVGAGLSSSAAIEVCTAMLLIKLYGLEIAPFDVARLCRRAENEFVGVNCGLLDQVSSVFGERDHVIFLDCRAETVDTIAFPHGLSLLIVNSEVKHALTGGEYNERRAQCFEAARIMGVPALRDATMDQLDATDMPELVRRRARHIIGENARVFAAVNALRSADAAVFGNLMSESHRSSIENFENSTHELDTLVEIAIAQPGVHGARLTGGGFGGAIVALVDSAAADQASAEILRQYKVATGVEGSACRSSLADGAARLV